MQRQRAQQPDQPVIVIAVEVREEDVAEIEGDPVAHHLPLGALAAIDQHRRTLADDRERRDAALHGGPRG